MIIAMNKKKTFKVFDKKNSKKNQNFISRKFPNFYKIVKSKLKYVY